MSHQDEPRHLLVRARGDRSPLYTSDAGFYGDPDGFTTGVPIDDPDLSFPGGLAHGLATWSAARPPGGFTSRPELRKHVEKGLELAQALAKHLGPVWVVRYWDEKHGTMKFVCWGCQRLHWTLDAHGSPPHPVHIIVEGEYKWGPLRAEGFGDFAPDDPAAALGLSDDLIDDLYKWSADFDASMNLYLEERDPERDDVRRRELDHRGEKLTERIARELTPGRTVTYGGLA
ncbi:hypothetical protein AF335_06195 [Streptomyces eurocidicus]|uniref:Uncharacterized protein n=1 Tax=Streptomyces eurocidicus TaxID=66423 RepID=A0A2N8NZN8_STREU|nr:hypothetical protein [Streptomyces eurocidicus]MBB5118718.1 hypothetical protein [Streptomyces eurocidicus]MBF6051470.1 hypothetical protein [Streptomyces eurocidicus]PNE34232.1 hypothetical protein AF335_06195 [Streptomyces eurocidicus]